MQWHATSRIASENARMGQNRNKHRLNPWLGGTQRLTRLIGATKAEELIFTGKMIDAKTAEQLGLVNMVVPGKVYGDGSPIRPRKSPRRLQYPQSG